MKFMYISILCCLSCCIHESPLVAMEGKQPNSIIQAIKYDKTSFAIGIVPLIAALLEKTAPSSNITKNIFLIVPYISFIFLTLDALHWTIMMRSIPTNNKATLRNHHNKREQLTLYNFVKNHPKLHPFLKIAQTLSINPKKLMIILGEDETAASFNSISFSQDFEKNLHTVAEKTAVFGHELCHIKDKVCYKILCLHGLVPLLTDGILLGATAYFNTGITATEGSAILQKNWFARMLISYLLNMPGLQFPLAFYVSRYYERKADIVSARLGNNAQIISNYFYRRHREIQERLGRETLYGFRMLDIFHFIDEHPTTLARARYLADIAIHEQHINPQNLNVIQSEAHKPYDIQKSQFTR